MYAQKYKHVIRSLNEEHVSSLDKLLDMSCHILLNGPDMKNNMNIVESVLREKHPWYTTDWTFKSYTLKNETKTEVVLQTRQSKYIFEIMLQPQGTVDKHIITDVVQSKINMMLIEPSTCKLLKHLVVLYNVNQLGKDSQKTISILMQKYLQSVTFILVSTQFSGMCPNVVSNGAMYRIPVMDMEALVDVIVKEEGVETYEDIEYSSLNSLFTLQRRVLGLDDTLSRVYAELVDSKDIKEARTRLYNLIVNNVNAVDIVKEVTSRLLREGFPHDVICPLASMVTYHLIHCERVIYHLEVFFQGLLKNKGFKKDS